MKLPVAIRFPFLQSYALAIVGVLALSQPGQARAEESLARHVPAEVGLFVEARGAGDLLTRFTDPQVWSTLAELAGQPARPEEVAEWRRRIRQTVKMEPEEAIRVFALEEGYAL